MPWYNPGWLKHVLINNYCNTKGRATRSEYWSFYFYIMIIAAVLVFITLLTGTNALPYLIIILILATFIPSICLQIRRLHDANTSGWCVLLCFVPYIGSVAQIVIGVVGGTPGDNRFGPAPSSKK